MAERVVNFASDHQNNQHVGNHTNNKTSSCRLSRCFCFSTGIFNGSESLIRGGEHEGCDHGQIHHQSYFVFAMPLVEIGYKKESKNKQLEKESPPIQTNISCATGLVDNLNRLIFCGDGSRQQVPG